MACQKVCKQGRDDIIVKVNLQSPIPTSFYITVANWCENDAGMRLCGGKPTSFQVKYTCTYRGRTPELKITKNKTWAWQGQKLHSKQKHNKII